MGIPRGKVTFTPRGVDPTRFTPDGPRAPRRAPLRRIVSVGRLISHKGFDDLIHALPGIPDTELIIVGGPDPNLLPTDPDARRLLDLATSRGVGTRVHLTGHITQHDLAALLRSADLVACTPWYTSSASTAMEAMACAMPILATPVGSLTDTVIDGVTGALVPPHSPQTLAATSRKLLHNPTWLTALGAAGCDRARVRYSWKRIAHETINAYQRCTNLISPNRDQHLQNTTSPTPPAGHADPT